MLQRIARTSCYGFYEGLCYEGKQDWFGEQDLDCYGVRWGT